jgi:gamma-glutamyltranspeptidase/glutathione hydrolase
VLADNAVATSQPLATSAGVQMLQSGGNAIDAALAAAIALTVVEPTSNGIGGDLFAIVWDGLTLHGLNASGRSPAACTRERFDQFDTMPLRGWFSVTVPGAVSGWVELSRRFGKLSFRKLFEPAIAYARGGFPVSPITAVAWQRSFDRLKEFPDWRATFAPGGAAPAAGERFASEAHARTLQEIALTSGESFYRGDLARQLADYAAGSGGPLTRDDLAEHRCDAVGTLSLNYHGHRLHEIPPNGQGIAALIALGLLQHFDLPRLDTDSPDCLHLQIEAMKLAFADAHRYVSDPPAMDVDPLDLLDPEYLAGRAKLIDPDRAADPRHGAPKPGGTVYLTAADADGRMISLIQSNYFGFGSGLVVPGTGIALQNRGHGFTLQRGHPNEVGPRKRPFHTIIPGFVTRDGRPWMSFGVMGGEMQPQGHVQMMVRCVDFGQNPQAASDAPRWKVLDRRRVLLERGWSDRVIDDLKRRGHDVQVADPCEFGGAQLIQKLPGCYLAASDHRKDGHAAGL